MVLPAAFVFGKREVIGAWLVWLTVAAACLGSRRSGTRASDPSHDGARRRNRGGAASYYYDRLLRFNSRRHVRKASRARTVNGMEIVGQIDEELDAMGYSQPNSGVRSIDASRGLARCQIDAILSLKAAVWDDRARVGYIRPIRLDLAMGIRAIFSGRCLDKYSPQRSEQQREHERGPDGIDGRQLATLYWVQNRRLARGAGTQSCRIPVPGA